MRTRRGVTRLAPVISVALLCVPLAACGGGDSKPAATTTVTSTTTITETPSSSTPNDSGVADYEKDFVDAERTAIWALNDTPGSEVKSMADWVCARIDSTKIDQLAKDFSAKETTASLDWGDNSARTFIGIAHTMWCSDKTFVPSS